MQPDRRRQADRFFETRLGIAIQARARGARLRLDMYDEGGALARSVVAGLLAAYAFSSRPPSPLCSWIGPSGMTVEIACL
ncbi:MAG: hypothetical protein WDM81_09175 [Rhizomicrobium sp.]